MASAARGYLAAGVAAMSVGVGSVTTATVTTATLTTATLPSADARISSAAYRLAAESSLLNVPVNLFNMVLSMPAWEIQAMERSADAMIGTGSWQVWGPTNVFGFDEWDPPKLAAAIDMLMPVKPFSAVFGNQAAWWAKANFPMNAGCAAAPGACPDFGALTSATLTVPPWQLNDGYQFPTVTNPFTLQQTSWSGQYVKTEPGAAFTALWDYLSGPSAGVQTAPIADYLRVPVKLVKSMVDAFYPFVQNSEWFDPELVGVPTASLFSALAPVTCPSCVPGVPFDNPWLYENYPPTPPASAAAAPVDTLDETEEIAAVADAAVVDVVSDEGLVQDEAAASPVTVRAARNIDPDNEPTAATSHGRSRASERPGRN